MIKLFKNLRKQEWGLIVLALVFVVAQVWLDLTIPDYMADITRLVQTDGSTMNEILTAGGKMLLCALGSLVSAVLTAICAARIATSLRQRYEENCFRRCSHFRWKRLDISLRQV